MYPVALIEATITNETMLKIWQMRFSIYLKIVMLLLIIGIAPAYVMAGITHRKLFNTIKSAWFRFTSPRTINLSLLHCIKTCTTNRTLSYKYPFYFFTFSFVVCSFSNSFNNSWYACTPPSSFKTYCLWLIISCCHSRICFSIISFILVPHQKSRHQCLVLYWSDLWYKALLFLLNC